jgi:two-component system sensor histidine kinase KdpD
MSPTRVAVWPRVAAGVLESAAAVAVVTGAIYGFRTFVPVLSLGVLYLFAVLPVAVIWGLAYAIPVSIASMVAFNFFFLPPVHTLSLAESENWFVLAVYLVTAIVVSELAVRARRRATESALLAEVATSLLEHGNVTAELDWIASEAARALQVERARITLGEDSEEADRVEVERYPLAAGGRRVGTIFLEGARQGSAAARRRLLPALASLLGVAIDRERLAGEALEAEALRRSDLIKTSLLRAVSHDLRSPLMAISTAAGALAHPELELDAADRAELLGTILDETERLDRLVANLLDLSRLQAGAARPQPELVPVDDLIVQALDELREEASRVDVSFPEDSRAVQVDAHQIQRVIANLLENALRYSPASARVHIQVTTTASEVLVRIVDRGPGVAPGELERIFEPFQLGSWGGVHGAGLGLAIARGFAQANGGRIWAESRRGQGATFVLALPLARIEVVA